MNKDVRSQLTESASVPAGGLDELICKLEIIDSELPPGEWQMQNSCSYRRIGNGTRDGNVLHAYRQASDGHPDLSMPEEQVEALCELRNSLPQVLATLRALRAMQEESQ